MNRILNKLTDHFENNRRLACITAGLFALGILVFIINNTMLFFVDEGAYPCTFNEDGSAVMVTEKGHQLELDCGFFRMVRVLIRKVPCIVPGGIRQIKELLKEQQA